MHDDEISPLEGDDLATWSAFATVLEWLPPALDAPLTDAFGLTHFEYGVLFALARSEGRSLRMSVLAGYANSTLSRLSRAVGRLEARGWAERAADPADGRFTLAVLTDAGFEQYERATPVHEATVRRLVLDVLTPRQHRQLHELSMRIIGAVRDDDD